MALASHTSWPEPEKTKVFLDQEPDIDGGFKVGESGAVSANE